MYWQTQKEMPGRIDHLLGKPFGHFSIKGETDHQILLAMEKQTKCPKCNGFTVKGDMDIKDLWSHEKEKHDSEDTATISAFVKLLREGKIEPEVATVASEPVHHRLLEQIVTWPGLRGAGLAKFWHLQNPDKSIDTGLLETIITYPNQQAGRPLSYPMKPAEFLSSVEPEYNLRHSGYDYENKWKELKEMYAKGEI